MRAFWDQAHDGRNFGDALTAVLFEQTAGIRLEWAAPEQAELFGIGSAAEAIPQGFRGIVFGTGKMFPGSVIDLSAAQVLALRGPMTAEGSGADCDLLADPGLLVAGLPAARGAPWDRDIALGWIPHYIDARLHEGHRIDVLAGVEDVIRMAARCERIVSSSLHGLVLADALGIPNLWDPHPGVMGDGFKFRDYAASYGEVIRPGIWRRAPVDAVIRKTERLKAALASLPLAVAA